MPTCPQCGEQLGSGEPAGLCPKCLILGAFDSSIGAEEPPTQTIDIAAAAADDDDFGRYQILRPIGEGGMGTVYLAQQLEPIHRRVALKVVKLGMDTAQVLARFSNERQALAMMDHPNIAQIYDAGATAQGRPYFVMEYIEGVPITQYCDSKRMSTKERLALFLAVCRAVQHAHQKGVIHRDLKPSNVLVMEQDSAPVPKVIDFGIAKATDKWAVEKTLLTQFGQIVGTPEYASPEQADTMTGVIDEASDVYSLGVLLYELLVGAVPFDTDTLRHAGLAEMLRIIREEEAPSLPQKLTSMGPIASDIAARRQTDPASLRRLVDGDLNSITMKALEKARERRYASVSDLAGDLQRHLEHRPVLASPPSRVYRVRKFLRGHRLAALGTAAGAVILGLSGVTVWSLSHSGSRPKLTEKDTIVLADFDNKTGDAVFDQTLRQGLGVQLEQSPFLRLVSDQNIQQALHLMNRPTETPLTPDVAREVCERTGGSAVLEGSIAGLGSQYVLWLRATSCRGGDVLAEEQALAGKKEEVLSALSRIATQIRTRLGESLAVIQEHSTPLERATTSSLEALKAYSAAKVAQYAHGGQAAISHLQQAIAIDPQFAMAHADLGFLSWNQGETDLGAEQVRLAYKLRDRVSDRERRYILMLYDRVVTGNLQKELQTLEAWAQTYPRDTAAVGILGGWVAMGTGQYERGIQAGKDTIQLDPNMPYGYTSAAHYTSLDRFTEAEDLLRKAAQRNLEIPGMLVQRYYLAFMKGDQPGMAREIARAPSEHAEDWMAHHQALVLARSGQMRQARVMWDRATALANQAGRHEDAAIYTAAEAVCEARFGSYGQARTRARSALDLAKGRDVEYSAAFALALSGELSESQKLAADLAKRFPEDTPVQFEYLPTLHALFAIHNHAPSDAIERLETSRPYDLAMPGTSFFAKFGGLYPAYVRGEAYLAAGRGQEAAAEFQKVLGHRGIVLADPVGVLAHLQLGRVFALSGDKARAKAAYETFFSLWKDADPAIPILTSAKAEYGRL